MAKTTHTIKNNTKFQEYTIWEQGIFEAYREAQLMQYPKWEGEWDSDVLDLTESAAFKFVDLYPEELKTPPPPPVVV